MIDTSNMETSQGSSVGAVVRALAVHQCGPGLILGSDIICGLSLLVLYSAPRGLWFVLIWFPVSPMSRAPVLG